MKWKRWSSLLLCLCLILTSSLSLAMAEETQELPFVMGDSCEEYGVILPQENGNYVISSPASGWVSVYLQAKNGSSFVSSSSDAEEIQTDLVSGYGNKVVEISLPPHRNSSSAQITVKMNDGTSHTVQVAFNRENPFRVFETAEGEEQIPTGPDGSITVTRPRGETGEVYLILDDGFVFTEDCPVITEDDVIRTSIVGDGRTIYRIEVFGEGTGSMDLRLKIRHPAQEPDSDSDIVMSYDIPLNFEHPSSEGPSNPDGPSGPSGPSGPLPMLYWDVDGTAPVQGPVVTYTHGSSEEAVFYVIGLNRQNEIEYFTDTTKTVDGIPPDFRVEKVFVNEDETEFCYKVTIPSTMQGDFYCQYLVGGGGGDLNVDDTTSDNDVMPIMLRTYDAATGAYGPFQPKIETMTGTQQTYGVFFNGALFTSYSVEVLSAQKVAPASAVKDENGFLTVTVSDKTEPFWLSIAGERPMGTVPFLTAASYRQTAPVTIDGKLYTLAWGVVQEGRIMTVSHGIGWDSEYLGKDSGPYTYGLALFENYGDNGQSLATDKLSAITRVEAKLLANGSNAVHNVKQRDQWQDGMLLVEHDMWVEPSVAVLAVDVTIGSEIIQLQTMIQMTVGDYTVVDCETLGLDTLDEISDYIKNEMPLSPDKTVILQLKAGHTYEGTLVADRAGKWILRGTKSDKNSTVIHGSIRVRLDFEAIEDILFLAPDGENTSAFVPDGGNAHFRNCVFFGYDTALDGTKFGRADAQNCLFVNNGTAISWNLEGGSLNHSGIMTGNTFLDNDCAIDIISLPSGMVPYDFRFANSDFINNTVDIRVPENGRYYAHGNFFGDSKNGNPNVAKRRDAVVVGTVYTGIGYKHPLTPAKSDEESWWIWHLYKNGNIVKNVSGLNLSAVLLEDSAETALDLYLQNYGPIMEENAENPLVATGSTVIPQADAETYELQAQSLERLELQLMDQEDAVTGTWKFDAALPGTLPEAVEPVMALMEEEEIGLSETFNPAVSVSLENEDILVTVKDSAAVRSLCPVLEIPCQIGVRAVVTLDGVPVAAYGDADSVQFQVVQGGTYRITIGDTAALTLMQEQNDTGLSVEVRVDNWTEQTWTGTPYCAVYSAEGQLLSIGQAEAAITVSGNARGTAVMTVSLTDAQRQNASYVKVFFLGSENCPLLGAAEQRIPLQ